MSAENQEVIDVPQEETPNVPPMKAKKHRSQAQVDALARARERAVVVRKQYAEERKQKKVEASRPPSPEPQPEPVREPSPEPDFSDHADDFSEAEEEAPAPAPPSPPRRPQVDKETISEIIGTYKEEKKRLKEAEPRKKFSLHPSGYYVYDP
jgi:hypothetical protein